MLVITTPLKVSVLPRANEFKLEEPMGFYHQLTGHQEVPIGFVTDFASIPSFFKRIFNVNDVHREEAVVHDWLYYKSGNISEDVQLSRKDCDFIFLSGLKKEGIPAWKSWSMYRAVRLFGGKRFFS